MTTLTAPATVSDMPNTEDLSTWTPVEIDTVIARIEDELAQAYNFRDRVENTIARITNHPHQAYGQTIEGQLEVIEGLDAKIAELRNTVFPFKREYKLRRWTRYFLVTNGNGHVHYSTECRTCYSTTSFAWLVNLAGQSWKDMVEEWGEKACTTCFPGAPTLPRFSEPSRQDQAAKAERAAEKAEREAKKAEKNLTPAEYFRDGRGNKVTTVAAAKTVLRDAVELCNYGANGERHPWADAADVAALEARKVLAGRGMTDAEMDRIVESKMKSWGKQMGVDLYDNPSTWVLEAIGLSDEELAMEIRCVAPTPEGDQWLDILETEQERRNH